VATAVVVALIALALAAVTHRPATASAAGGSGSDLGLGSTAGSTPATSGAPSVDVPSPDASTSSPASSASTPRTTPVTAGPFAGDLMIADRQNGRIVIVDTAGTVRWQFPVKGSLPAGRRFAADDAFLAPDGLTIVANEEEHEVIDRIDLATRRIVWQFGRYGIAGRGPGEMHTPDDAYPLPNGDVIIADIDNCRVIEVSASKRIVHQWGRTGVCVDHPPQTYGRPNGDTPLPDGGLLITEITGSRVVRLDAAGQVMFDIHVPASYPSDAHLDANGNVVVVDYSSPGAILRVSPTGHLLWRYGPTRGPGRLDHPSLAMSLPNGSIILNDDFRNRVLVVDPRTRRITWSYGHTDRIGRANGYLYTPDGLDLIPPAVAARL
jgi:hypothetical protein